MTIRIQENIPPHLIELAQRLDVQIQTLEEGRDTKSVFNTREQRGIQILGPEAYLAYLKRTRQELGQPDSLSEE